MLEVIDGGAGDFAIRDFEHRFFEALSGELEVVEFADLTQNQNLIFRTFVQTSLFIRRQHEWLETLGTSRPLLHIPLVYFAVRNQVLWGDFFTYHNVFVFEVQLDLSLCTHFTHLGLLALVIS